MVGKSDLPPWESKGAVNRAGAATRNGSLAGAQAATLESWRMAHQKVIHAFEATLRFRARSLPVQVAQRLKRRRTIVDKLIRYPRMELARMDDVAGCRLIFKSIEELYDFRNKLHQAKFRHVLRNDHNKDKYDYIKKASQRGYRGVHDIYEYRAQKGRNSTCNGLLIEIQYRTETQHAWATAVEVVTQMTENEPKFNRGDQRHIRLFCLASEILARAHEKRRGYLTTLADREVLEEFYALDNAIGVTAMLSNLVIHQWVGDRAESAHVILQLTKNGELKLHHYDLELEASKALLDLEKEYPEDDVVLVGAKTAAELTSAFRNYFKDVKEFLRLMDDGRNALAS